MVATVMLKLAEVLQAYQNTAKGFWHSRVSESFTLIPVWSAPYGVRISTNMSLACRIPFLPGAAGNASVAAILRNAANAEADMDGM